MDVAALKYAARHVRTIRRASAQLLERGRLVSKGFQKGIRKFRRIKRAAARSVMACSISTAFMADH
jgi:hypothetical protein